MSNITHIYAAKGGAGATVTACALALHLTEQGDACLLLDLGGDCAPALGMAAGSSYASSLLEVRTFDDSAGVSPSEMIATAIGQGWPSIVVDWGQLVPDVAPDALRVLVTRADYLALRRACALSVSPDRLVVIEEPGRALSVEDCAHALGVPSDHVVSMPWDPAVARAVDAGLLGVRPPASLMGAVSALPFRSVTL